MKTIPVAGNGGWDYLLADSVGRRLYVSHGDEVNVLNLDSYRLEGTIAGTNGVHGIAVATDLHRGFTSDGRDDQVTIFDLNSLATIGTVKTGGHPDAIVFDPFSARVFTFNGKTDDMTAIDADSGYVAGTVPLGGRPEFAATDNKGNVYVNLADRSELVRFDPKTLEVQNHWPLAPCESPSGLAIDAAGRRLFSVCENKMMVVVDADRGKVIAHVPTGEGTDAAAYDPASKLAFASNGEDGTLTIVRKESADQYQVVADLPTRKSARTMALDSKTHSIFLAFATLGPAPKTTAANPHPWPTVVPGTFKLLIVSP